MISRLLPFLVPSDISLSPSLPCNVREHFGVSRDDTDSTVAPIGVTCEEIEDMVDNNHDLSSREEGVFAVLDTGQLILRLEEARDVSRWVGDTDFSEPLDCVPVNILSPGEFLDFN